MPDDLTPHFLLPKTNLEPKAVEEMPIKRLRERHEAIDFDSSKAAPLRGGNLQRGLSAQREWAANELVSPSTRLTGASAFNGLSDAFGVITGVTA